MSEGGIESPAAEQIDVKAQKATEEETGIPVFAQCFAAESWPPSDA